MPDFLHYVAGPACELARSFVCLLYLLACTASHSRRPEIENSASGRPGLLRPESRPEAPGRPEVQTHYLYNNFLLGAEHPRAAGPKSEIKPLTDPAG